MSNKNTTRTVGIYLFDDVEVLDFAGPFEVFSVASNASAQQQLEGIPLLEVFTIADSIQPIQARGGLTVTPKYKLGDHPDIDILIVPGGAGVSDVLEHDLVIQWIAQCARTAFITASVCSGSLLLAKAGLLDGKQATSHWGRISMMREMFPQVEVIEEARWVDTGKIVSSAGISAGIDMSLHLVERIGGRALAERTARVMEFDWQDSGLSF